MIVVAPDTPSNLPRNWQHYKASRITADVLKELITDVSERTSYVSGPPTFVGVLKRTLRKQGARTVKTDYFVGY